MNEWRPHPGPQEAFCSRWEFEVLGGGQAGGGKTDLLIMEAARYVDRPNYWGIIFRRTFPQLQEIIDRCLKYYTLIDPAVNYKATEHRFYWPSGAKISLAHMQHDVNKYDHQGFEYQFIGFDEVTQFLPTQYFYLFSRCRSADPTIPCRIRSTSNPGGVGHYFVKDRFKIGNVDPGTTIYDKRTGLSRVFIPFALKDNPSLQENDPGYVARLMQLPPIEQMRLLEGVWDAFEGQVFCELNTEIHGIDMPLRELNQGWEYFRTFDWGYSAPACVLWWGVDADGRLFLVHEYYCAKANEQGGGMWQGLRMSDSEMAREIKRIEREELGQITISPGPADPTIWNRKPKRGHVQGPSTADEMAAEGLHWLRGTPDRIGGKRQFHQRLRLDGDMPNVLFSNQCTHFWRTVPLLQEDPKNIEDVDTTMEDHAYDPCKLAFNYRPMRPQEAPIDDFGSFRHERRKYIKAKGEARRRGISLAKAYENVR